MTALSETGRTPPMRSGMPPASSPPRSLRRSVRKYGAFFAAALQNGTVYSASFIIGSMFVCLVLFMFLQLWEKVAGTKGMVAGYSLNHLIWYYCIAEIVTLSRSDILEQLNNDIRSGDIAIRLLRPCSYLNSLMAEAFGQIVLKAGVILPLGIGTALLLVGPLDGFRLSHLPLMLVSLVLGFLLSLTVEALVGLTAFRTEDNVPFWWIVQKLAFMLGLFMPLEMLPGWLRGIAVFLPFPYMLYAPARLTASFAWTEAAWLIPVQLGYLALLFAGAHWICRKGVRGIHVNGG